MAIINKNFNLIELKEQYQNNKDFHFTVLDNFVNQQYLEALVHEHKTIPDSSWIQYKHFNEKKRGLSDLSLMGNTTKSLVQELSAPIFTQWLSELSCKKDLFADPELDGGGLHNIKQGGFLNIHTDYQSHTKQTTWKRVINLLLYLSPDYEEHWGGHLELRHFKDQSLIKSITPKFNRCVIFTTTDKSFHGHPYPLNCPKDSARRSLALYYFQDTKTKLSLKPTFYTSIPQDSFIKKSLITLDRYAVYIYSALKRHNIINDQTFTRLINKFKKS